jgi:hypothetical protein
MEQAGPVLDKGAGPLVFLGGEFKEGVKRGGIPLRCLVRGPWISMSFIASLERGTRCISSLHKEVSCLSG